ncbi:MAG TPA: formylglycine-generating enzyme family protein [Polyangiaceae bacterium]|nr:formylglycine-generating enzyme family protein [Polyangiaceae bacterium]
MNRKYWLLLSLAPLAAAPSSACSSKFETCEVRRTCPRGGAGGASAGVAGAQEPDSMGARAGEGGSDETAGGGTDRGDGGESGESPGEVCIPDQPACDGNRATTCNAEGTGYLANGLKCSTKQTCLAGACEEQECSPNASFCSGNSVRKCADNGLSSDEVMTCGSNQYCEVLSASCKTGVCAANQPACDGKRATACTATGDGYLAGGTVCKTNETCDAGECKPQVCTPDQDFCQGQDVKTCSMNGLSSSVVKRCTNQTCVAATGTADCKGVCSPGQQDCSGNGVRSCDATGQYGAATKCTNKACVASGTTASCVGNCEPGQTQCSGNRIQSCTPNGVWNAATLCPAETPICIASACQAPVSCNGLKANCGPSNESCCTSPIVTGGTFKRDNNANYPATISDFRLDKYEVTVGRFRKFVAAVLGGWTPAAGSGKHTYLNNGAGLKNSAAAGYETGWDPTWNVDALPTNKATWDGSDALGCNASYQTWTASGGGNETLPINCVDWFKAEAFCIWDGGFLPSEAEWNYAAAGGGAQRAYPWGSTAPGMNANLAVYGCYLSSLGTCSGITNIAPVGSVPLGNGLYGQADLAGNIAEWNLDGKADYTMTCDNCAYSDPVGPANTFPALRGGSYDGSVSYMASSSRANAPADWHIAENGLRCARIP